MKNLFYSIMGSILFFCTNTNAAMVIQGTNPLNAGQFNVATGIGTISLTFKNTGATANSVSSVISGANSSEFKVSLNRCSNIASNKTCQLSLTSQRNISVGNKVFLIGGVQVNLSIVKQDNQGNDISNPPAVESLEISPASVSDIQFSSGEKTKSLSLTVKNSGNVSVLPTIGWSSNNAGVKIAVNRCSTALAVGKTCSLILSIPAPASSVSQDLQVLVGSSLKDTLSLNIIPHQTNPPASSSAIVLSAYSSDYSSNKNFISRDQGLTFEEMILPNTRPIQFLLVSGSNIIFREDDPDVVWVSSDNGLNFNAITNPNDQVVDGYLGGSDIVLRACDNSFSSCPYYYSSDLGQTFQEINIPTELGPFQSVILDSGRIILHTASNSIAVSNSIGQPFTIVTIPNDILSQVSIFGSKILAQTYDTNYSQRIFYFSNDFGQSWSALDLAAQSSSVLQTSSLSYTEMFVTFGSPLEIKISLDDGNSFSTISIPSSVTDFYPNVNMVNFFPDRIQ